MKDLGKSMGGAIRRSSEQKAIYRGIGGWYEKWRNNGGESSISVNYASWTGDVLCGMAPHPRHCLLLLGFFNFAKELAVNKLQRASIFVNFSVVRF